MDFKECNTSAEFINFFDSSELAYRHTHYYHYTSLKNVSDILDSQSFRLTLLSKTANDNLEKSEYEKLGNNLFSLCFSTGTSESLPLWYLYSGIDGKGARIEISKKDLKNLLTEAKYYLVEIEDTYPYKAKNNTKPIALNEEDYKMYFRDILYMGSDPEKHKKYQIKYNGKVKNDISFADYNDIQQKYKRFIKGLIWFYEKESRLQIEITNKQLLNKNKSYVVTIDLESIVDKLNIRLAPEFEGKPDELFEKYSGLKKWAFSKLQDSDYAGQLDMNLSDKLCRECTNNKM